MTRPALSSSDATIVAGAALIVAAVFMLAGPPWGVMAAGVGLILLGLASALFSPDRDEIQTTEARPEPGAVPAPGLTPIPGGRRGA